MGCITPKAVQFKKNERAKIVERNNKLWNLGWKSMGAIPCRNCIGCKIKKSQEWATRGYHETKKYKHNYTITLTYNDQNINYTKNGIPTIKMDDLRKFINSLRKKFERKGHKNIKILGGAEYGTKTMRPHFHIIFFNLPLTDLKPIIWKGKQYWWSNTIENLWGKNDSQKCPNLIDKVTTESISYCVSYSFKKLNKKKDTDPLQIEPEKLIMSKNIGKTEFDKNYETWYKQDHITIKTKNGIKNVPIGEYYDKLYKKIEPEKLEKIKKERMKSYITNMESNMKNLKLTYTEILGLKQTKMNQNLKKYKSNLKNK